MAFMRETPKSLGWFFGLLGIFALLMNGISLLDPESTLEQLALILVAFGCCWFYIGVHAQKFLASSPGFIVGVTVATGFFWTLRFVALIVAKQAGGVGSLVIGLLLCWYLLVNTRRLAREQGSTTPSR
jgi:fucose 4-O-acetylase-like acetyltransferase